MSINQPVSGSGGGGGGSTVDTLTTYIAGSLVEGRLTLTSGTPVTTSDVTAATTLYFTPFNGNTVGLYDGSAWGLHSLSEISIAVPAQASQMYDVFLYDNAGTLTLELTAWTNDTTRATALTTQDGVYVRTGATTRRYLGSFRTTASAGQTEDSEANRLLWNYYNRVSRTTKVIEATANWTYNVAAWRAANNSTTNRFAVVVGLAESPITACVNVRVALTTTGGGEIASVGIGVDSVAANSAQVFVEPSPNTIDADVIGYSLQALYSGIPGIGYHYFQWLEYARAGTVDFYGNLGTFSVSGMLGMTEG